MAHSIKFILVTMYLQQLWSHYLTTYFFVVISTLTMYTKHEIQLEIIMVGGDVQQFAFYASHITWLLILKDFFQPWRIVLYVCMYVFFNISGEEKVKAAYKKREKHWRGKKGFSVHTKSGCIKIMLFVFINLTVLEMLIDEVSMRLESYTG